MSYQDNIAWDKGMKLVVDVYEFSECLPRSQRFVLLPQIQRSVTAIPSNIAEGYGRSTKLDYARFVDIALGSTRELQTQLELCERLNYGSTQVLIERAEEIARILYGLSKSLRKQNGS